MIDTSAVRNIKDLRREYPCLYQKHYVVRSRSWKFNITKNTLNYYKDKYEDNFFLIIGCGDNTQEQYPILLIPFKELKTIIEKVEFEKSRGRWTFEINQTDYSMTWRYGVHIEGVQYLNRFDYLMIESFVDDIDKIQNELDSLKKSYVMIKNHLFSDKKYNGGLRK